MDCAIVWSFFGSAKRRRLKSSSSLVARLTRCRATFPSPFLQVCQRAQISVFSLVMWATLHRHAITGASLITGICRSQKRDDAIQFFFTFILDVNSWQPSESGERGRLRLVVC